MSDEGEKTNEQEKGKTVKLGGLYAFKLGMSTLFHEGQAVPVTVLEYRPWVVSQLKTKEKDGYEAVQIACTPKRASRRTKAQAGHLSKSGFENGAQYVREVRQALPEGVEVGQNVDISSLVTGDVIKVTGLSKGRGFAGVVKRWHFAGGPASHGSTTHRRPGSIGNNKEPARVMPGKRMAGHFGNETATTMNMKVIEVIPEKGVLMVKGAVPGARNSIVKLVKV